MATTYIYNLDHFILRVVVTGSKYSMEAQNTALELQEKTTISHPGEYVAVEGFFLWSSQLIQVLRIQAFQQPTKLYHMVKICFNYVFLYKLEYFHLSIIDAQSSL